MDLGRWQESRAWPAPTGAGIRVFHTMRRFTYFVVGAGHAREELAGTSVTDESGSKNLERLCWHCRRGLLELDIVLGRFVGQHYAELDAAQQAAFDVLLDMPDTVLWDMIVGRQDAAQSELQALLEKIRAV